MRPSDLAKLRAPADPTLSPDGSLAVVAVTRPDLEDDAYRSDLWAVPTNGESPPRKLTHGPRDAAPRFSPDGQWLAFLRADDGPPQLMVMPVTGGEPRTVTDHPLGAGPAVWSPDSTRIAYAARVPEDGRYGTDEKVTPDKEPPRLITTYRYRLDGVGFTLDRRSHIFVAAITDDAPEPTQITSGDFDHHSPFWHPDGTQLGFVSARHDSRDTDFAADLFLVDSSGGDAQQITNTSTTVSRPAFTPDGATVLFAGTEHTTDTVGRNTGIFRVDARGGEPARITDAEPHDIANPHAPNELPLETDGSTATTVRLHRGAVELVQFDLVSGDPDPLITGPRSVLGYAQAQGVTVAVVAADTSAGEVFRVGTNGELTQLTAFGDTLARETALRPMTEVTTEAADGYPVHGWVIKPAGTGPFPVLLNVHGGPFTQYGYTLFDEAQVYAGAGYAVVMGNPRGSQGYGEAHGRAIVQDFGTADYADLTALLDAALEDPALDSDRVGVMGGSYGGFMTTWMVGHTDRFTAAISERSVNVWDSFLGSSDIGPTFVGQYIGTDPEEAARQSPLTYADNITTPTFIIHSEHDWRCPLEQAQRLYVQLKRNEVETQMLLFPGEGHELTRSGLPSHRAARFDAILDWWNRHLG